MNKENETWEEELEELLSPYPRLPYEMKDLRDKLKSFIRNRFLPKDKVREIRENERQRIIEIAKEHKQKGFELNTLIDRIKTLKFDDESK